MLKRGFVNQIKSNLFYMILDEFIFKPFVYQSYVFSLFIQNNTVQTIIKYYTLHPHLIFLLGLII